jgi:hypothetical protein
VLTSDTFELDKVVKSFKLILQSENLRTYQINVCPAMHTDTAFGTPARFSARPNPHCAGIRSITIRIIISIISMRFSID